VEQDLSKETGSPRLHTSNVEIAHYASQFPKSGTLPLTTPTLATIMVLFPSGGTDGGRYSSHDSLSLTGIV
jgi:hypothetical protein